MSFGDRPTAVSEGLRLFNNPDFSDVIIQCKGRTWKVHRAIVCGRCEFFRACLEHDTKEAQGGIINLPEDDPDVVDFLLKYLYTYDINLCRKDIPEDRRDSEELGFAIFSIADKYGIVEAKSFWLAVLLEASRFSEYFEVQGEEFAVYAPVIADSLTAAYQCCTPGSDEIRRRMVDSICSETAHHQVLFREESIKKVLRQQPDLQKTLLLRFSSTDVDNTQYPLYALLKHASILRAISKKPDIAIELIQNLAAWRE